MTPRLALLGALLLGGCAAQSPLAAPLRRGELVPVRQQLETRLRAGSFGSHEARELAKVTLTRELETATGTEAVHRVLEAESCVHDMAGPLRRRAHRRDAAAAEALLVLYEAGEISRGAALDHEDDADSTFRRVAVRALDQAGDHERRSAYFTSSDGALRVMALRAAMIAGDPREVMAIVERARLDPEPDARSNAVRALALLDDPPEQLAAVLAEIVRHDDGVADDVAVAWSLAPTFEHGGREALLRLLESEQTRPELRALTALLVLRTHPRTPLATLASAVLVRALRDDPMPVRLLVLRASPEQNGELGEAVRELARHEGATELGIAALALVLESAAPEPERTAARARLFEIAKVDGGLGSQARGALARAGDRRVQAWLEHDLTSPSAVRKLAAARGLAALGVAGRAAPLFTDADASVRARAACLVLQSP